MSRLFVAFHLTAILGLVCEIDHRLLRKSLTVLHVVSSCVSRVCRCRNATSVMPQQPVYERHKRGGRKTTKPQAEARKCPAKFADGENLRSTDAVRSDTSCHPACAPAFDPDEI